MQPHVYVIPGAGQSAVMYGRLLSSIADRGWRASPIEIKWSTGSPLEWTQSAQKQIEFTESGRPKDAPKMIIGFSYGGIIAMHVPLPENCSRAFCSIPDVYDPKQGPRIDSITRRNCGFVTKWDDYEEMSIANRLVHDGEDLFYCGTDESKSLFEMSIHSINKKLKWQVTQYGVIKGATHDVNAPHYVKRLGQALDFAEESWDFAKMRGGKPAPSLEIRTQAANTVAAVRAFSVPC